MRRTTLICVLSAAALTATAIVIAGPAGAVGPAMAPSKLDKCGFTRKPNLSQWPGGTATMVPQGRIPAGKNTIIQGKAATGLPDGTRLELLRFNPSGNGCHGSLDRIGSGIATTVKGGNYYINFQLDRQGSYGYALQAVSGSNSYEIEFQITTP